MAVSSVTNDYLNFKLKRIYLAKMSKLVFSISLQLVYFVLYHYLTTLCLFGAVYDVLEFQSNIGTLKRCKHHFS